MELAAWQIGESGAFGGLHEPKEWTLHNIQGKLVERWCVRKNTVEEKFSQQSTEQI